MELYQRKVIVRQSVVGLYLFLSTQSIRLVRLLDRIVHPSYRLRWGVVVAGPSRFCDFGAMLIHRRSISATLPTRTTSLNSSLMTGRV